MKGGALVGCEVLQFFDSFISLFLAFCLYSFIGWGYESTLWAKLELRYFTNRGYLLEPFCPIYGFVSVLDWYMLKDINNPLLVLLAAMIFCSVLEYTCSYIMEKFFNKRWWDYSNYPFNLNGRISLPSSLLFGIAGLFLVKILHPMVMEKICSLSIKFREMLFFMLTAMIIVDIIITTVGLKKKSKTITSIYETTARKTEEPFIMLTQKFEPIDKYTNAQVVKVRKKYLKAKVELNSKLDRILNEQS